VQANPHAELDTCTRTNKCRAKRIDLRENTKASDFRDRELPQEMNRAANQATSLPIAEEQDVNTVHMPQPRTQVQKAGISDSAAKNREWGETDRETESLV
jgi:hypothetical protein